MCKMDLAAKEAAIARFLHDYPEVADAGPLDESAAAEARRVLTNTMFSISDMNPAMPEALPFLLRLVNDPQIPERSEPLDLLVTAAQFSEPIDARNEAMVRWFGSDSDHPERERCRAVFAEHASVVARLPEVLISPAGRATLRQAAGLL